MQVKRHANAYQTRSDEAARNFLAEINEKRTAALQHKKKRHQILRNILKSTPSAPLVAVKRTKSGANGEAAGTITTKPMEVDEITTAAWQSIYSGNATDQQKLVDQFMHKYSTYIYKADQFIARDITAERLQAECTNARPSAGGMDQWAPDEMALLSLKAFKTLVSLLKLVENGAPWPQHCQHARASFLSKDPDDLLNPLSDRVLLMLPVLYRRWASLRLHDLSPWVSQWQLDSMCAGVESKSAEDGWWNTNMLLEQATIGQQPFTGGGSRHYEMFRQG